jgi:hypothetical protein
MTEPTVSSKTVPDNRLSLWLFNPFKFLAGVKALLLGLVIILASGLLGWLGKTHFDGVLDVHIQPQAPLWCFLAEGLINWICMVVPLFFFGLIISNSSFRLIDVLGTQALARGPYLIAALVMLPDANRRVGEYLTSKFTAAAPTTTISYVDVPIFAFALIVTIFTAIWMVALMYRAYAISCNVKGPKAIITFIVSLIGAEVLSNFVIVQLII